MTVDDNMPSHNEDFSSKLIQTIQSHIESNADTIDRMYDLYENNADPQDSNPNIEEEFSIGYQDQELSLNLSVYYSGESHKLAMDKGYFSFDIRCYMEDTSILTDIKPSFYQLSEELFPSRQSYVTQDYPRKELRISYELDAEEFRKDLLNN